ncbi:MAG TPA: hypothetical protein DCE42_25545 [Myxococcales bacterium]|nr:hypothetical protein [Myxococcales bacterium]
MRTSTYQDGLLFFCGAYVQNVVTIFVLHYVLNVAIVERDPREGCDLVQDEVHVFKKNSLRRSLCCKDHYHWVGLTFLLLRCDWLEE